MNLPPKIILNTMPKSGSNYLMRLLAAGFDMHPHTFLLGSGVPLTDAIDGQALTDFRAVSQVSQNHLAPSPSNIDALRGEGLRLVFHLRDPRQALLSWVHHINILSQFEGRDDMFRQSGFVPPTGYFAWHLLKRIDWQIENYYWDLVVWATDWIRVAQGRKLPVLVTRFEDMVRDEWVVLSRILTFYGGQPAAFRYRTIDPTTVVHYRLGEVDEWRRVFSPEQKRRVTAGLPEALGYDR